jgi:hypothetical protein
MNNTIHLPNIRVKKKVRILFGSDDSLSSWLNGHDADNFSIGGGYAEASGGVRPMARSGFSIAEQYH